MRNLIVFKISLLFILAANNPLFGQENEGSNGQSSKSDLRPFGVGVHLDQLNSAFANDNIDNLPISRITFSITPHKDFRIETEIGIGLFYDKDDDYKARNIHFGTGLYLMKQKNKLNYYGGFKIGLTNYKDEYLGFGETNATSLNNLSVGAVLGAEYFLIERFSVGAEVSYKYNSMYASESSNNDDYMREYYNTESGVIVRFYF